MLGSLIEVATLRNRLASLGWLTESATLGEAVTRYNAYHGLPQCGTISGATERHAMTSRCCGRPDMMAMGETLQKWPDGCVISWTITNAPPAIPKSEIEAAYRYFVTAAWESACGVRFEPSANPKTALLTVDFSEIDGKAGVLAYSEMPDGTARPRRQQFDRDEAWVIADNPTVGYVDFVRVATHELGHMLGIPHLPPGNLLQPCYDVGVRKPQVGDIIEAQARYGKSRKASSSSEQPISAPNRTTLVIEIEGSVTGAVLPGLVVRKV